MTQTRVDSKDPRILHIDWTNHYDIPMGALATHARLMKTPKQLLAFKMFMVTRRSIVNPGEVLKFRIELSAPLEEYPEKAFLQLEYPMAGGGTGVRTFQLHADMIEAKP